MPTPAPGTPNPGTPSPASTGPARRPRLAVLLSGGGTTLQNLYERTQAGTLSAQIVTVIASNSTCLGIERARRLGLTVHVLPRKQYKDKQAFSDAVFSACRDAGADLVCLAGFLSLLVIPDDYTGKVLNIHPSLLPSFGGQGMHGRHVHEAVLAHGCKVSGCTVHLADNTYDTGPILVQKCCEVKDNDTPDTLAARVFELECEAYPEAIELHWRHIGI